ncbi:diphthamide synthesis protein [Candidatus Woesearchaeota archaeon]|nr:diphthamide synthesis protein [Candidatus Woesearchaeota archaeon]MCF7901219.1 diphthamide synthesis protein [Candidatus Woesearchaeota archaeon]MCF8013748.1 diphthamide synthesis protein [Candidatus Woesearchaeota archaeon]
MLELNYDLEKENIVKKIKEEEAKLVLIHLPDGLKPKAKELQDLIKKETNAEVLIWGGSNFGACDLPIDSQRIGVDLIIHFGHSAWLS